MGKIISLDSLCAKTTKGELQILNYGKEYCFHQGNKAAIVVLHGDDDQETVAEVWPAVGGKDKYDAMLMAHGFNRVQQAVNTLKMLLNLHEGIANGGSGITKKDWDAVRIVVTSMSSVRLPEGK